MKGRTRSKSWHPEETASQLPFLTNKYSRTSVGIAPREGNPNTPGREGEGTEGPWRCGATGCCRLLRQAATAGMRARSPTWRVSGQPTLEYSLSSDCCPLIKQLRFATISLALPSLGGQGANLTLWLHRRGLCADTEQEMLRLISW